MLPTSHHQQLDQASQYIEYLWKAMGLKSGKGEIYDVTILRGLALLAKIHHLPLRTLERVAAHLALFYAAAGGRVWREQCLVTVLCIMKQIEPDLFMKAHSGELQWPAVKGFLHLDQWNDIKAREHFESWWRYLTDKDLQPTEEEWVSERSRDISDTGYHKEQVLLIHCQDFLRIGNL
jgi:hypothetical protein